MPARMLIFSSINLLLSLMTSCLAGQESSCQSRAVGDSWTVPLDDSTSRLSAESHLTWTHNQTRVYYRKGSQVKTEKRTVAADGSLVLGTLELSSAGTYKAEIHNVKGTLMSSKTVHLCVLERVPKPQVNFSCLETGAALTCQFGDLGDVTVSWRKNGLALSGMTGKRLDVSPSQFRTGDRFSCAVHNRVSHESSGNVPLKCVDTAPDEPRILLGLDLWLMVTILAGGGGLFFMLLIICVVCTCRHRKHRQRCEKDEEEMRLAPLTQPDYPHKSQVPPHQPIQSRPLPALPGTTGTRQGPRAPQPQSGRLPNIDYMN